MVSLREAMKLLKTLVIISDNSSLKITHRDKQFSTKPNSYDVMTDEVGLAINMNSKEISWIQALDSGKLLVEAGKFGFWIKLGVKL